MNQTKICCYKLGLKNYGHIVSRIYLKVIRDGSTEFTGSETKTFCLTH